MHLNKHFLFIIGAPALLVLLVVGGGMYRSMSLEEDTANATFQDAPQEEVASHVVHEEGTDSLDGARVAVSPQETTVPSPTPHTASTTDERGTHFSGTLQKVNTGCFSDGECFVIVDGKHVTALRGWSQEVVGTVQGVEGFGDLTQHIGEQMDVYAYGAGDGVFTLYGNDALYIRLATTSIPTVHSATTTHVSGSLERPEVQ